MPMLQFASGILEVVAAQLVEAACSALQGDGQSAKARIERAVALLHQDYRSAPVRDALPSGRVTQIFRGGLAPSQARRVVAHIESNIASTIRVDDLAKLVNLSASHFCRAFRNSFGQPVRRYVIHRRVEMAQGLMLAAREPLSQIAVTCGMTDQPHFCKLFRRLVGQTPTAWRRARLDTIASLELHPALN